MTEKPKIMIVDTTETNLRYIETILEDKYRVSPANGGCDALDLLKSEHPDLILLNTNMTDMDGYAVMKRIQANEETADIPVILLMDSKDNESELRGLQAGAMDFITKPFVPDIMRTRIERILELGILHRSLEREIRKQKQQINSLSLQSVITIAHTIDAKDRYAKGHSIRVALYSKEIAVRLGWSEKEIEVLYYIALLHDIGKIAVEDTILNKAGALTEGEYEMVKQL